MKPNPNPAIQRFLAQQTAMVKQTRSSVEKVKRKALAVQEETIRMRDSRHAEISKSLATTVTRVRGRHEAVRSSIRQATISRDVHLRVSRSLESLEEFVRVLRESNVSEQKLLEAIHDPVVSGSFRDRERRASVSDLLQSVQKQLIQRNEFINIAAHELRTPIMPILMNSEILQSTSGKSKELDAIVRNAMRLQQLAENILSAAKIDSSSFTLNKEEDDLNLLIRQIAEDQEKTIGERDLRIVIVPETERFLVEADISRIGQVVSNLLDNAIKFTSAGSILITTEKVDGKAVVTVQDDGPGIDPEIFPLLFSKFATKSTGGTGLGLFICKTIVDAHGGTISAKNRQMMGKSGAIFSFTLPLSNHDQSRLTAL
ncbi:MAG: sensor histidine kinase [Nitrososphaerales archaeon]